MADMSSSLNVVNIALVFCASFSLLAIFSLILFIFTLCSLLVPAISVVGSAGGILSTGAAPAAGAFGGIGGGGGRAANGAAGRGGGGGGVVGIGAAAAAGAAGAAAGGGGGGGDGAASERMGRREQQSVEEKREARLRELLEAEPELNTLPEDVICPVCLDLLHEPFQVEPCGHIFCEPCLRRLGQKNPMNCTCPLCRTKIGFCKHLAATAREIREEHEGLYLKRKKFERSTPVFSYPLPWQPGWRNLIRGRPLGGNRFLVRDNRAEYMRAILHQIPYYIPPVMIANLINIGIFAFMMGFIEVFPNLLALVFGSGKNMSLPLNATEISETSGDLLPTEADSERSLPGEDVSDDLAVATHLEDLASPVLDTTFYYILFALSVLAAALGQFLPRTG